MLVEAEFECGLTEFAARAIFLASPLKMTAEVIARALSRSRFFGKER